MAGSDRRLELPGVLGGDDRLPDVTPEEQGQVTVTLRLQTAQFSQALRELHRSTLRLWLYGESRADSARRRRVDRQMALVRRRAARNRRPLP